MDSFLVYQVKRYDIRGKQYLSNLGKYYVADLGLRSLLLGRGHRDLGHLLENVIYLELLRRDYDVCIGQMDSGEVDFVAQNADGITYFQVAASVLDNNTLRRELKPLQKINNNYPKFLLTLDEIIPNRDYNGIRHLNALDWLRVI